MITKIGVIYQDANSIGFLRGIRDRLKCRAEFIGPPTPIGKTRDLPKREALKAWKYFQKKGVQLVVRFTDADRTRWQDVRRREFQRVPDDVKSIWLCGVAVENVEGWLYLDTEYLSGALGLDHSRIGDATTATAHVKKAIIRTRTPDENGSDVVARLVRDAPSAVFRRWLKDRALRAFYSDCRDAAARADCQTPNELDGR